MRLTVLTNLIVSIIFLPFLFGDTAKSWECQATTEGDLEDSIENIGLGLIVSADCTSNDGEQLTVTDDSMLGVNYNLVINFSNGDVFRGENKHGSLFGTSTVYEKSDDDRVLITGPVKNLIFDGIGEITYKDGSIYKGNIYFSEPNGEGELIFADGTTYDGEFIDGEFSSGEFKYSSGDIFRCQTINENICYGYTEIIYSDGPRYLGNYINDKWNGSGRLEFKSEAVYEGIFLNGQKHGLGTYFYEPSNDFWSKFEGLYLNDDPIQGSLFDKENRLVYSGEVDEKLNYHGQGTLFYEDGFYSGEFKNDVPDGFGRYVHDNGWFYEGQFRDSNWNGPGKLAFSDETYIGNFKDGYLEGEGTYIDSNIRYEGNFNESLFNGFGKVTFLDTGETVNGQFEKGEYIGLSDKVPSKTFKRVALVIGNDLYETGRLDNAVNDSIGIKLALERSGFRVIHAKDLNQVTFLEKLEEFENILGASGPNTEALFYYAGHAVQVDGINYLNPIDAKINTKYDLEIRSVNLSRIFSILDKTISGIKIVILDACRNNPFNSFVRSPQLGLAQMNAPTGTYISYSTAPGSVALDGTIDGYGYFTGSLVSAINTPGLTIEEVFKKTRLSVISLTDGQQIPWEASSLLGDFYFQKEN